MSDLIPFDGGKAPAHISNMFGAAPANITANAGIPSITFRGKVWRIHKDGDTMELLDDEGNPRPSLEVIIINQNPNRSRSYFDKQWEGGATQPPRCTSYDGVTPDSFVTNPVSGSCATCPMSVKGSKISETGSQTTACSVSKLLAVVPAHDPEFTALQIRLPITSIFDGDNKDNEAKGWFAWDQYVKMLVSRGVSHTAAVITKIRFDSKESYPKLLFNASNWLDDARAQKILPRLTSPEVVAACGTLENKRRMANATNAAKAAPAEPSFSQVVAPTPQPAPAPKKAAPVVDAPVVVPSAKKPDASEDSGLSALLGNWDD